MLTLTALKLITQGLVAFYTARRSDQTSCDNPEIAKYSDDAPHLIKESSEALDSTQISQNVIDTRCEMIFYQIAKTLENPHEESVYIVESLFEQLKLYYPYNGYIQRLYNSCDKRSDEDIEDFAVATISEDFSCFLSKYIKDDSDNKKLAQLFKSLSPLLKNTLRGSSYIDLMASYFKDEGKQEEYAIEFQNRIWKCYEDIFLDSNNAKSVYYKDAESPVPKHTSTPQIRNYDSLLGMAGRTYTKLKTLLATEKIFDEQGNLSNELVYDIAGSILEYTDFYFCRGLSTSRLAKDIMDSMIDYLHNSLMEREKGMTDNNYVDALFNRYLSNREIHSYNYFLKMGGKICHSISSEYDKKSEDLCIPDTIRELIIENINRYDFPFLRNVEPQRVYEDIIDAYNNRKWELPQLPEKQSKENETTGDIG